MISLVNGLIIIAPTFLLVQQRQPIAIQAFRIYTKSVKVTATRQDRRTLFSKLCVDDLGDAGADIDDDSKSTTRRRDQ